MFPVRTFMAILLCYFGLVFPGCTPVVMPDLVGVQREIAEVIVSALGLSLGAVSEAFDENAPTGEVTTQDPAAGTPILAGAVVRIQVSKGALVLPEAAISSDLSHGIEPLLVHFADASAPGSGEVTAWSWDFGDAGSGEANLSTERHPQHIYEVAGTYPVTLTVTTPYGSSTASAGVTVTSVAMAPVPAGIFSMGDPWAEGQADELPVHEITLSGYEIGLYEVTNQEYADMLNWANLRGYLSTASEVRAGAYGYEILDVDDDTCLIEFVDGKFVPETRDGYSMANHPVLEVVWVGATAYCNWLSEVQGLEPCYNTDTWECDFTKNGYHLPTEAQWERAAGWDGERHFRFPVSSDEVTNASANFENPNPLGLTAWPITTPVGYYAETISPVGCFDMCGNAWEWCNDSYDTTYYANSPSVDPLGPSASNEKVRRGGGWIYVIDACRTSNRISSQINTSHDATGFRIAR
ncbi:MAG: SUMF1/EgtB/PvdO family nonheme iron enzyme [Candidatus Hydrogenedentes bacterium]|nr:SUMF1/EgtB/PvdO family nonheme iron enzyme [Candidatus Hydrogenedentota bacterium]